MKSRIAKWLRLFCHDFRILIFGVVLGTPSARAKKISSKISRIGIENWWTLMSQIIYNPGALGRRMVRQMIFNTESTLRAVNVNWNDNGWNVNANSVENPNEWNAGNRVFSRNY